MADEKAALALKPKNVGRLVEPELKVSPPRPFKWCAGPGKSIGPKLKSLLVNGVAARAWVVDAKQSWDAGSEAGPNYSVKYCFEAKKGLVCGAFEGSFDGLHLAYGSPELAGWMGEAFSKKGTFTVLYEEGNPRGHKIYGLLELFVKKSLVQLAGEIKACKSQKELDCLSEQFFSIAISPLDCVDEWEKYYGLMHDLGFWPTRNPCDGKKAMGNMKRILSKGKYDKKLLGLLSSHCEKHQPGVWAAK